MDLTGKRFEGQVSISRDIEGYVKVADLGEKDSWESVHVIHKYLNTALQGDRVIVEISGEDEDGYYGKIIQVISRSKKAHAGNLLLNPDSLSNDDYYIFDPQDKKTYFKIFVDKDASLDAKENNKVAVEIVEFSDTKEDTAYARVVKNLGHPGHNDAEMLAYAIEKGFSDEHTEAVKNQSEELHKKGITDQDKSGRRDFRDVLVFTIDPSDAKDFDDAISYKELDNGHIEVGVHIADVSYYVTPESPLDSEAVERQTSVYLVDRVIPMLPEVLSNDLCSLVEGEDRLVMSAVFEVDIDGNIYSEWYGRSLIHSNKRFSYENAQESMSNNGVYSKELNNLNKLAKNLFQGRVAAGALILDTEEVKFKLDENGHPIDVYIKHRGDTHKMIEELMLLANRKVSEFITASQPDMKEPLCIYRIHDKPDAEKMHDLNMFIKGLGEKVRFVDGYIPSQDLNNLIEKLGDRPEKDLLQNNITRSLQKAIYSTHNVGHYGLAFEHYSHFTSPIRRYPDVLTHRILMRILDKDMPKEEERPALEKMCIHASYREKEASDAERGSIKYKQVEYMGDRIGQEFDGTISGVARFGIYVEEKHSKCEGLIRMRDLGEDFYNYIEDKNKIIGERSSEEFKIGDRVRIKVKEANLDLRVIDYELIKEKGNYNRRKTYNGR
ncbi:MAG: ribonuclease [Patescibacteria group bacterium]|nr:ribonuclease [Patescibacteria group bacterium]